MPTVPRLAQLKDRTARHHLTPVIEERLEHLLKVQSTWLAIDQRHHIHAKAVLQLGVLVEVVQYNLG